LLRVACSAGQQIGAVMINGTIVTYNGNRSTWVNCAGQFVEYSIPDNVIKQNDFNTIGVLFRSIGNSSSYADIYVSCTGDNTKVLRNYWSVDAINVVGNALNRIVLSTIPPGGGCTYPATKVVWLLRGHRIGAACSCYVDIDGTGYIIVKRSLGVDMSCGGGESTLNPCVSQFLASIGDYPAIAWQSIDGIEGIGVPNSGNVGFTENQALSDAIIAKIRSGDITHINGDPASSIQFVVFPTIK
jgi:hypothetical protein